MLQPPRCLVTCCVCFGRAKQPAGRPAPDGCTHGSVRAHQVKLRGFRVELGEIENALSELPGVQLAAALVLQDPTGSQRLVAYVTPAFADPAAAKADLRERLPAHMVPDVVVPLERMPLLPNEKVDRKALPAPDWGAGAAEYVAPASKLEARLQAVWQEVLGRERISAQADFFCGHSCWTASG